MEQIIEQQLGFPPPKKQPIPDSLRWAVWERDGFKCQRCGSQRFLAADHIVPESKGGQTVMDNLQTLCKGCNSSKGNSIERRRTARREPKRKAASFGRGGPLRALRARLGMTQAQLARRLNVSRATVNSWECGRSLPTKMRRVQIEQMERDAEAA